MKNRKEAHSLPMVLFIVRLTVWPWICIELAHKPSPISSYLFPIRVPGGEGRKPVLQQISCLYTHTHNPPWRAPRLKTLLGIATTQSNGDPPPVADIRWQHQLADSGFTGLWEWTSETWITCRRKLTVCVWVGFIQANERNHCFHFKEHM